MVLEMLGRRFVPSCRSQSTLRSDQFTLRSHANYSSIKQDMMVRAKANEILSNIRAVVGPSKRSNMCPFRVGTHRRVQYQTAYLAAMMVLLLDPS